MSRTLPLRGKGNCPRSGAHSSWQIFPGIIQPRDISFPHLGQFIKATPLRKQKNPCLNKETKAISSAVPLFLPGKIRPLKLCPVTGAPGGAYFWFSPLLQGDFPGSLPSASHQTAALCACWGQVLVLFCAFRLCAKYLICFFQECQGPGGREMRKY